MRSGGDVSRFATGIACALVGAVCWGFSGTCAQYLFTHYAASSFFVTVVRSLGAGVLFLGLLVFKHRTALRELLKDNDAVRSVVLFGCAGVYTAQLFYLICIDYTNAGTATVLQALNVVFVLFIVCVTARRLPRPFELVAIALAFFATVLIATKGDFDSLKVSGIGLAFGILSAAAATFYVVYPKRLFEAWGSVLPTGLGMLVSGVAALVVFAGAGLAWIATGGQFGVQMSVPALGLDGVVVLVLIVVVGTFGAYGLYLHGVSVIGSVKGSLLGTAEPVSATVIATLWLGTAFGWADWVGMVLMIATVFIVSLQKK